MKTVDADIKSGNFSQIYLFYGDEDYLKKQYRDKLKHALMGADGASSMAGMGSDMNFNAFEGKDINPREVIDLAETLPFFADRRVILIENSGFFKNKCDELAEYLTQAAPTTFFLFVENDVDEKKSKLYNVVKKEGRTVKFSTVSEEVLIRWILTRLKKEGKKITEPVMQLFLDKTGTDMGTIDRELEKLISYTYGRDVIEAEDVETITTEQMTNKVYEMINAVAAHNQKKALDLYYDLLALKVEPTHILSKIVHQFHILLLIRSMMGKGFDNDTMAKNAGINPRAVRYNVSQARGFTMARLRRAVTEGVELEEAVKTGHMDKQIAVELFLVRNSAIEK